MIKTNPYFKDQKQEKYQSNCSTNFELFFSAFFIFRFKSSECNKHVTYQELLPTADGVRPPSHVPARQRHRSESFR